MHHRKLAPKLFRKKQYNDHLSLFSYNYPTKLAASAPLPRDRRKQAAHGRYHITAFS
jgi:hypothetical protein